MTGSNPSSPEPDDAPDRRLILIVDDDVRNIYAFATVLEDAGMKVVFAENGREGIERLHQHPNTDLVLLDINLAYPDGLAVLKQVRGHEATRRAPIVVVAGGDLALSTDDALLVDGVVQKPFDIDLMLNAVRKALGDPIVEVTPRQYDAQDYFLHGY